jgi:hypothetical protein
MDKLSLIHLLIIRDEVKKFIELQSYANQLKELEDAIAKKIEEEK